MKAEIITYPGKKGKIETYKAQEKKGERRIQSIKVQSHILSRMMGEKE